MKKTYITIVYSVILTLVSCSYPDFVIESDSGNLYNSNYLDQLRGMASGKKDAEVMRSSDNIISKAGKPETDSSGTYYPGTVKVISWENGAKYQAMRLVKCKDGTEFWQGPNPPSGFYGSKLSSRYIH